MPRRLVEERRIPVGTRIECVRAPRTIAVVDCQLAPGPPARGAVEEGRDPGRGALVVPIVGEDEARCPALPAGGAAVAIRRVSHWSPV
ncbi:MAG: hypothetical protein HY262_10575 [Chloroflexi bacterium]|nr:hypothetical protein [Chloroflexota bacterium]